jgi:dolichol kinase
MSFLPELEKANQSPIYLDLLKESYNPARRKLEHLAPIAFCPLLKWLSFWELMAFCGGAVIYGVISGYLFPSTLKPEERGKTFSSEKIEYALSVTLLIIFFFPKVEIVALGWAALAIGDAAAGYLGSKYGKRKLFYNHSKTLEGSLAFVLLSFPFAYLFMWFVSGDVYIAPLPVFIAIFGGALMESLPLKIDDNISVPIVTSLFYVLITL